MEINKVSKKIYIKTIISFLFVFLLCSGVTIIIIQNQIKSEILQMEQLILESSYRINAVISKQLYKTSALAALVIQGDGVVHDFQQTASVISADMPALANFLLAPDGVVTDVYPLEGNEAVIGLDFFNELDHAGNREAVIARDLGDLVMAGPFLLRQGGVGLVGRYPVYIDTETEKNKFWGLVSVSLKFPEALEDTGLSMLEYQGISYELWRINPDTDEKQIIATGNKPFNDNFSYVERPVKIHNAEWFFRVFPIRSWYERSETWLFFLSGLFVSALFASLVQNHIILKVVKMEREIAEANEFNRILYDNAPIGINTFDKDFNFIDYNDKLLNLLGASDQNFDFLNEFSPEYQPDGKKSTDKAYEHVARTMNGENLIFEWVYKSASGEFIPCEITTTRVKYKGEIMGLSYIYDLSHVKNMESKIAQMESKLAESKISIMLSQIQPHFLYNALTAIAQLCDENPAKAKKATLDFSMYLRSNMVSLTVKGLISVEKELQHVESYLNLEKAIYGSTLNVIFRIEAGGFLVPPLTIQPIVENAIKHGIGQKEGGGTVTISVRETNMEYIITVADDGAGYDINNPRKDTRKHIGINNVRQRLKEQCRGTLDIISEIDSGTTAAIKIPKEDNA